jgi:DNA-binding LacI/PurR family transcriptional regulator
VERPTIKDVAARAGVSKSLVSRVLHDHPRVSDRSRAAVLAAIRELGYTPNGAARTLVARRSLVVAVLVTDLRNLFLPEVVAGVDAVLGGLGYITLTVTGKHRASDEEAALRRLVELRVDGIVCATVRLGAEPLRAVSTRTPVVSLTREPELPQVDTVVGDDHRGATLVVEHLAGLGHRRIAMVADVEERAGADRIRGYLEAMTRLGLGDEVEILPGGFSEGASRRAAQRLLGRRAARPTAVFAASDLGALGVLDAAAGAGLRVPGDLSVAGYDNTPVSALRHIGLTTVDQSATRIGTVSAEALLARIAAPGGPAQRHTIDPTLVPRRTTSRAM